MKIVVLAGGLSPERDVSLSSGCMISNALADKGHAVVMADLFMGIKEPAGGLDSLFKRKPEYQSLHCSIPSIPPDLDAVQKSRKPDTGGLFGENILPLCQKADAVFLALHGAAGENGQLQAAFDLMNITYTGTGYIGCALAMDKIVTKQILTHAGIPTAPWISIQDYRHPDWNQLENLGYPIVIKPVRGGSSIGTSIAHNHEELISGLEMAARVKPDIMAEKYMGGHEIDVGVLDGKALMPIEIIPKSGFFDYEKKYQDGLTREVVPAEIPDSYKKVLMTASEKIHQLLQLGYYSRIDFKIVDEDHYICMEANTLPGMTPASLFPKEAAYAGISYADLCNEIVEHCIKPENRV